MALYQTKIPGHQRKKKINKIRRQLMEWEKIFFKIYIQ